MSNVFLVLLSEDTSTWSPVCSFGETEEFKKLFISFLSQSRIPDKKTYCSILSGADRRNFWQSSGTDILNEVSKSGKFIHVFKSVCFSRPLKLTL